MLEVTWEWIALDTAALDLANTVAVDKGVAHDLLAAAGDYQRWTQAAARSPELTPDEAAAIAAARPRLLGLREPIRAVLHATTADQPLPGLAVAALNAASRAAAQWPELGHDRQIQQHALGDAVARLLARYARSTMEIAAGGSASCGSAGRRRAAGSTGPGAASSVGARRRAAPAPASPPLPRPSQVQLAVPNAALRRLLAAGRAVDGRGPSRPQGWLVGSVAAAGARRTWAPVRHMPVIHHGSSNSGRRWPRRPGASSW